jgi:selenocysteine lyase/cysteine desulfurase
MPDTNRPVSSKSVSFSEQFPILENGLYFNHAAVGPWPRCTSEAVQHFAKENMEQGSAGYRDWLIRENRLRENLAELTGASSAKRFEAGSPNTMGQAALHASIQLLPDHGTDEVGNCVLSNTDFLLTELEKIRGVHVTSNQSPERRSGIISFRHGSLPPVELHHRLTEAGVSAVVRSGSIRLSPHFYQGEQQLLEFLEILESALSA